MARSLSSGGTQKPVALYELHRAHAQEAVGAAVICHFQEEQVLWLGEGSLGIAG